MSHKKTGFIEAAMRNRNIVIIIAVLFMLAGVVALQKMARNEFPTFTIRQGVVVGVYPGATSAEVEAQLSRVVENYTFGFKEVRKAKTYSQSKEGIMYLYVELNDNVTNADEFWSKYKHGLSELKSSLPMGVLALVANSDFGDTSALLITLTSDTKSYKELEQELKKLEAGCRKIPATSKIKHYGLQKEQIFVNVKPELLNEYNIKSISLLGSYSMNGMVNYAGELKDGKNNLAVHLPANFESEKDLADQIVYSDPRGNVVRLKNIATIERRYEDPDSYIKQNGQKTILLSLEMQPGNNIVEYGTEVDKAIATFQKHSSNEITVSKISELPKYVEESVSDFMKEFLIAIVAVILVTLVLLPFRVAAVAGITVPIAVLITLSALYFFGVELHTVSLAGLILVLGMIVDNSIVVIDNHVEKIDHGFSPWHAAIKSAKELLAPIITATLAIMAAYIPLGFLVPGTTGEFIRPLPIVISIALVISVAVAVLLVPYLNFVFIKKGLNKPDSKKTSMSFLDRLQSWFDRSLETAFKYPKTVLSIGIASILIAVALFKALPQQMFPELERNQFAIEVYLPTGASLESTALIVDSLESVLMKDNRVTNVTSFTGCSSPRFHSVYAPNMPSPNYGQLLINTISNEATREIVNDYSPRYSDSFPNAHVKWKLLAMQATTPIEIRISSDSIKDIRKVEAEVNEIVKKTKNIAWVRDDWDQQHQNIMVSLDRDKANRLGYSKGLVSTMLMIGLDGLPLTTIWEDDYPVEVRLSQETKGKKNINTLADQYINSSSSYSAIPLRSFASFTPEWTEGTIVRRNGTRTLTIKIDNDSKGVANDIFTEIRPQIDKLQLTEGTSIIYGGEYESSGETYIPMGIALGLSIVLIFFIILFQFKKVKLSFIIMSTMLLSLPGTAIGLTLMGYPFSTTAFIGIISLCGMVVRNGIILIDYARELKEKQRMPIHEAALAAGKRRMRPIFLTAAAASAGVVPMILSRSPLWGPVGTVICFGLMMSMVLTLYILPIMYSLAYTDRPRKQGFWNVPPRIGNRRHKQVLTSVVLLALILASATTQAQTLSLDSCKSLAVRNNKKIIEAELKVKSAEEVRKEAFTNYFPKVSASAMAMRSTDYLVKGEIPEMNLPVYDGDLANLEGATQFAYFPATSINALDYMNMASLSIALPLYAGGQIRNGNKLAALGEDVSRRQQAMTTTEVLVRTDQIYWNVIALSAKLKTLDSYGELLDTLNKDVNSYVNAGLTQRNDLLKVQLKQNEWQSNRLKLLNGISLTKRVLCQHIGIPYDSLLVLSDMPKTDVVIPEFSSASEAVINRDEYQLLNKATEAEELQLKMTRGELMPQLAVSGMATKIDVMNSNLNQNIGLVNLSIPISDWWGGSHKMKQQQFKIQEAKNKLSETSELLFLQIEQARNELQESFEQIKLAKKSVEQSKENLKVTDDNYRSGNIDISDLLEAQALFQSSNDNLTNSQCNYQVAMSKYLQAIGKYK
ncbi:MAG TPA: efflux RND transporter permease subunit [Prolixibacteraceae bacterium]|nr:efflux RND transporter permease subunit [Prolixibacteraceae bacterium]